MSSNEKHRAAHIRFMAAMENAATAINATDSYRYYCEAMAALNACAPSKYKTNTMAAAFHLINHARREMRRSAKLAAIGFGSATVVADKASDAFNAPMSKITRALNGVK